MSLSSTKKKALVLHLLSIMLSVVIATALWYMVSIRDRIEMQIDVSIDYIGIPKNLIVTDGLIRTITVRLRGPEALLRGTSSSHPRQQIDLSHIKKGVTVVPFTAEKLSGYYRAFDVLDVQPPRIVVKADHVLERTMPVQPELISNLRKGAVTVTNIKITPSTVTVKGPESIVGDLSSIRLPLEIDTRQTGTVTQQALSLDAPGLVTVTPSNVQASYTITSRRIVVEQKYQVAIASEAPENYKIIPGEAVLKVDVPEALAKSRSYLNMLKLTVIPPADMDENETRELPVHLRIPDGMTVMQPHLEQVTITRIKDSDEGRDAGVE